MMESKTCRKCRETKPVVEFYRNNIKDDGYTIYCKLCMNAKRDDYNKRHPEKKRALAARYRLKHPRLRIKGKSASKEDVIKFKKNQIARLLKEIKALKESTTK